MVALSAMSLSVPRSLTRPRTDSRYRKKSSGDEPDSHSMAVCQFDDLACGLRLAVCQSRWHQGSFLEEALEIFWTPLCYGQRRRKAHPLFLQTMTRKNPEQQGAKKPSWLTRDHRTKANGAHTTDLRCPISNRTRKQTPTNRPSKTEQLGLQSATDARRGQT